MQERQPTCIDTIRILPVNECRSSVRWKAWQCEASSTVRMKHRATNSGLPCCCQGASATKARPIQCAHSLAFLHVLAWWVGAAIASMAPQAPMCTVSVGIYNYIIPLPSRSLEHGIKAPYTPERGHIESAKTTLRPIIRRRAPKLHRPAQLRNIQPHPRRHRVIGPSIIVHQRGLATTAQFPRVKLHGELERADASPDIPRRGRAVLRVSAQLAARRGVLGAGLVSGARARDVGGVFEAVAGVCGDEGGGSAAGVLGRGGVAGWAGRSRGCGGRGGDCVGCAAVLRARYCGLREGGVVCEGACGVGGGDEGVGRSVGGCEGRGGCAGGLAG